MILLLDNYDSFAHNLGRYLHLAGWDDVRIVRNDRISLAEIKAAAPRAIVISPGPCTPDEAGICLDAVQHFGAEIPVLGVCLGHQVIAQAYGADIIRSAPMHGRSSTITHDGTELFAGLPNPMAVGRYHSLILAEPRDNPAFRITARTQDNIPMALQHNTHPVYGVQFHPESILTPQGLHIIKNFKAITEKWYKKT
jgi:anthranilate synthase/aminodeoxychorismate synthase-like glutamine amidotransferase